MDTIANASLHSLLRQTLQHYVNLGHAVDAQGDYSILDVEASRGRLVIPPEEREYLRKLIWAILDGRDVVAAYNNALLALLGIFTIAHLLEKWRCRKRRLERRSREEIPSALPDATRERNQHDPRDTSSPSSSSSVSSGVGTPSGALKDSETDLERLPLLRTWRKPPTSARSSIPIWAKLQQWLEYQPRPLPVVHRVLPSNGTSIFVLIWLGINIFFHLYQLPLHPKYFFCFADRAGYVFIVNLPLLYLLAAKNQPILLLTGRSYEALNIFHRRVGEWMCFEAVVHTAGMFIWEFCFQPDWLKGDGGWWAYVTHPLILLGFGALFAYELLFFTSLGSFRQRWYELFLASHVILQILALGFLYLHFWTAQPYVLTSLVIFVVDRVIWRLGLKSTSFTAETNVLPDGETIFMSMEWDLPASRRWWILWPRKSIRFGWKPTDHVFLTVPILGRTHRLQAHPFTIASAAPESTVSQKASLELLIRSHSGFTADLLCYAHRHRSIHVRLDGPYGSSHALDMLRAADHSLLVAGGSGIAVMFPLAWALLCENRAARDGAGTETVDNTKQGREGSGGQTVRMLWIIHSAEHRFWLPQKKIDQLLAMGLDLLIPPPTSEAGRPDVEGTVQGWIDDACIDGEYDRQVAMVASGPDGLNRMVRNTCARAIGKGADVRLAVEKFGW